MRHSLAAFLESNEHAAHGPLGKFKDALPDRNDIKAARRDFAYFSTAVTDLVRENHLHHVEGWHIFQCPMAPGIGTGRWLQRSGALKNPFYGAAMPDCGDEIDSQAAPPSASNLEIDHHNMAVPTAVRFFLEGFNRRIQLDTEVAAVRIECGWVGGSATGAG